jgi:hypothetical protein
MRIVLVLLLLASVLSANTQGFLIEKVDVKISDIKSDGSAKIHESIKFVMYGNYSNSLYDSSITSNDLSTWHNNTGLSDVRMHVNTRTVGVKDFRLRPQPRKKCNPIQGICHGELILDYWAYPTTNSSSGNPVSGTGLFTISKYKPRTMRYTINPSSLSFTTTPDGNIILDKEVYLTIKLPSKSVTLDVNPQPTDTTLTLPASITSLSWTDIVLVKFSLVFDVEESIDKEVADFFAGIVTSISSTMSSTEGSALLLLIAIIIGSYLYIIMAKRRGEE